jgi:hypothetical protein
VHGGEEKENIGENDYPVGREQNSGEYALMEPWTLLIRYTRLPGNGQVLVMLGNTLEQPKVATPQTRVGLPPQCSPPTQQQ